MNERMWYELEFAYAHPIDESIYVVVQLTENEADELTYTQTKIIEKNGARYWQYGYEVWEYPRNYNILYAACGFAAAQIYNKTLNPINSNECEHPATIENIITTARSGVEGTPDLPELYRFLVEQHMEELSDYEKKSPEVVKHLLQKLLFMTQTFYLNDVMELDDEPYDGANIIE